ncbi:MAG: DUF4197 domain-containing protein [Rhodospirillaceae bacterium]|nr:DUF4197 domain-containing protein [Rhodospirillaceae bacterium]MBT5564658.1 DUF4197 domain-containing protein [Rhodospirillaceae bacterium]
MNKARTACLAGALIWFAMAATTADAQSFFDRGKSLLQGLGDASSSSSDISTLTSGEISNGLREALRVGSERVVDTLGRTDGFNTASDIHIPLPGSLKTAQSMLSRVGKSGLADDLELRLNRAAEAAVPAAKGHFTSAIEQMTIDDAKIILNGPNDSATQYFRRKMSAPLAADMKPIVEGQLATVGVLASYDKMMGQYKNIPFAPDVQANLTDYVLEKAIDGVFLYLGREEAAIRENPAKRTTELLQKVFSK